MRAVRSRACARAALGVLLCAGAAPAWAYKCTRTDIDSGPSLTWRSRRVAWVLDGDLSAKIADKEATQRAIEASFQAWTDVPCSDFEFTLSEVRAGAHAGAPDGGPFENVVTFVGRGWPYDRGIIALTTATYDEATGSIDDADIEINDVDFDFFVDAQLCPATRGNMDLQNTITHEAGHVLGLDHPPIGPAWEADTMYANAPPCETDKRTLADDDMAGVCAIYPLGQETQPCFPPDGPEFVLVGTDDGLGCSAAPGAPLALGLLALAAIARRARLARRGRP